MDIFDIPTEIGRMTPRERWKWVRHALADQQTAWNYKRGIAGCFYANDFGTVKFMVDDCGILFDGWGEKYLFVMRRDCDNHGYIVSRFGVIPTRVYYE